jgi:hypothetical protein
MMWWSTSLVGGSCVGSWNKSSNSANRCFIYGLTLCDVGLAEDWRQMANLELLCLKSLAMAFIEVDWIDVSIPCNLWVWLCHWNSIVNCFQLHTTVPYCFNQWTPKTKSNPTNAKAYKVRTKGIPWSAIWTFSNFLDILMALHSPPWHWRSLLELLVIVAYSPPFHW